MIFIVLPAYNEEKTLPPLLKAIKENMDESKLPYRVAVVDDGSVDRTARIVRGFSNSLPVTLVEHSQNKGLAETLKTGLLETVKAASPEDVIITMDADNTHPPGLIPEMVKMVEGGHDVVIASRYLRESKVIGVPFTRKLLSSGASIIFRLFFPIKGVKDYTSGYRAYRAGVIKDMFHAYGDDFIDEPGFSCMADILLKMRKYPVTMDEVPLILRYDRKASASKMKVAKTAFQTLRLIWKTIGRRD